MKRTQHPRTNSGHKTKSASGFDKGQAHHSKAGGAFTGGLLLFTGFSLVGFAVVLQFGALITARVSPEVGAKLTEVQASMAAQNIPPFFLAMAGFVAFCFGLIYRVARQSHVPVTPSPRAGAQPDFRVVATEFAGGLNRVQGNLEKIAQRITDDAHAQRVFQESLPSLLTAQGNPGQPNGEIQGLARNMATGLDAVNSQIEQRVESLAEYHEENTRALSGQLAALSGRLQQVHELVTALSANVQAMPSMITSHAAAFGTTPGQPSQHAQQSSTATQHSAPTEKTQSVEHDIFSHVPQEEVAQVVETPIDTDRLVQEGLEVLGQLEDGKQPIEGGPKHDPKNTEFFEAVTQIEEEFVHEHGETHAPEHAGGPAPGQGIELQVEGPLSEHPEPPAALPKPKPQSPEQLDSLLPDDVLRQALGGDN
ncbi:MAG: hypothetical protein ACI9K5_003344 [Gammaproteobacteria bacterium]|jgi:hypothetical protein